MLEKTGSTQTQIPLMPARCEARAGSACLVRERNAAHNLTFSESLCVGTVVTAHCTC